MDLLCLNCSGIAVPLYRLPDKIFAADKNVLLSLFTHSLTLVGGTIALLLLTLKLADPL
jgi:hypothetical protein